MGTLLQNAFEEMKKRNVAVSALIPAGRRLFDYYRSYGYT
jgi:predicted acetyltransferase